MTDPLLPPGTGSGLLCPIRLVNAERPPLVLVVDDDELNRDVLLRRLEQRGYATRQASSGAEALDLIARHAFDLVLLDVQMPVMSGYEVLQRIRIQHSAGELPVIMVTARDRSEDVVDALALGANDYIVKPIDLQVMLARIDTQLQRKQGEARLRETQQRYAAAAAGAGDAIWDWTLDTNELFCTPSWRDRFGCGHGPRSAMDEWFNRIHPDDRVRVRGEIDAHVIGVAPHLRVNYRLRDAGDSYRWVRMRGLAVRDAEGRVVRLAGSFADVTESWDADSVTSPSGAKTRSPSPSEMVESDVRDPLAARRQMEDELRRAVEHGEFCLHYQPVVQLDRESVVGFEALIRWRHPERGFLMPDAFVPEAEEAGLLVPLGRWVARAACGQLATWRRQGCALGDLRVSVNLSSAEFREAGLVDEVCALLHECDLDGRHLEFEITERTAVETGTAAVERLGQLKGLGVSVCLDDFGAGHSSLANLHRLPVDRLKIDRSFVARLFEDGDGGSRAIVRAVLAMARDMGIEVVAEGIEEVRQLDLLCGLSCQLGQGYLFSNPLTADVAAEVLRAGLRGDHWQMGQGSLLGAPDGPAAHTTPTPTRRVTGGAQ